MITEREERSLSEEDETIMGSNINDNFPHQPTIDPSQANAAQGKTETRQLSPKMQQLMATFTKTEGVAKSIIADGPNSIKTKTVSAHTKSDTVRESKSESKKESLEEVSTLVLPNVRKMSQLFQSGTPEKVYQAKSESARNNNPENSLSEHITKTEEPGLNTPEHTHLHSESKVKSQEFGKAQEKETPESEQETEETSSQTPKGTNVDSNVPNLRNDREHIPPAGIQKEGSSESLPEDTMKTPETTSVLGERKVDIVDQKALSQISTPPSLPKTQEKPPVNPEYAQKHAEAHKNLQKLSSLMNEVVQGKKLETNADGLVTTTDRNTILGVSLFGSRAGNRAEAKDALNQLNTQLYALMDELNTYGTPEDIAQLQSTLKAFFESSWAKTALKNNPEINQKYQELQSSMKSSLEKSCCNQVKQTIDGLKNNPIIQKALEPNASIEDITKAMALLQEAGASCYGVSVSSDPQLQQAYTSSLLIKSALGALKKEITGPITAQFMKQVLGPIISSGQEGTPIALSQDHVSQLQNMIRQSPDRAALFSCFEDYKSVSFQLPGTETPIRGDKLLAKLLFQENLKELLKMAVDSNFRKEQLSKMSPVDQQKALQTLETLSASLPSLDGASFMEIAKELQQLAKDAKTEDAKKNIAAIVVSLLRNHAISPSFPQEVKQELLAVGDILQSDYRTRIQVALNTVAKPQTHVTDQNNKPILDADGRPVVFSTLIAEALKHKNPNDDSYDPKPLQRLTEASLQAIPTTSQTTTPIVTTNNMLQNVVSTTIGSQSYKENVKVFTHELNQIGKAIVGSTPPGIFNLSTSEIQKQPSVIQQTALLNRVSGFVADSILAQDTAEGRQKMAAFYVDTMKALMDSGNYMAAIAISSGLSNQSILPLFGQPAVEKDKDGKRIETFDLSSSGLDEAHQKTWKECHLLLNGGNNRANIRNDMAHRMSEGKPIIPPFNVLMTDHTFIIEGNATTGNIPHAKLQKLGDLVNIVTYARKGIDIPQETQTDLLQTLKNVDISDEKSESRYELFSLRRLQNTHIDDLKISTTLLKEYQQCIRSTKDATKYLDANPGVKAQYQTVMGSILAQVKSPEKRQAIGIALETAFRNNLQEQIEKNGESRVSVEALMQAMTETICKNSELDVSERHTMVKVIYQNEYNALISDRSENSPYSKIAQHSKDLAQNLYSPPLGTTKTSQEIENETAALEKELLEGYLLSQAMNFNKTGFSVLDRPPVLGLVSNPTQEKVIDHFLLPAEARADYEMIVEMKSLKNAMQNLQTSAQAEIDSSKGLKVHDRLHYQAELSKLSTALTYFKRDKDLKDVCKSLAGAIAASMPPSSDDSPGKIRNDIKLSLYSAVKESIRKQIQAGASPEEISRGVIFSDLLKHIESLPLAEDAKHSLRLYLLAEAVPNGEQFVMALTSSALAAKRDAYLEGVEDPQRRDELQSMFMNSMSSIVTSLLINASPDLQQHADVNGILNSAFALSALKVPNEDLSVLSKVKFFEKEVEARILHEEGPKALQSFQNEVASILDRVQEDGENILGLNSTQSRSLSHDVELSILSQKYFLFPNPPSRDAKFVQKISQDSSEKLAQIADITSRKEAEKKMTEGLKTLEELSHKKDGFSGQDFEIMKRVLSDIKEGLSFLPEGEQGEIRGIISSQLTPFLRAAYEEFQYLPAAKAKQFYSFKDALFSSQSPLALSGFGFVQSEIKEFANATK